MGKYYKFCGSALNPQIIESQGELFKVEGVMFYIELNEESGNYAATEFDSGLKMFEHETVDGLKQKIESNIEKVHNAMCSNYYKNVVKIKRDTLLRIEAEKFKDLYNVIQMKNSGGNKNV